MAENLTPSPKIKEKFPHMFDFSGYGICPVKCRLLPTRDGSNYCHAVYSDFQTTDLIVRDGFIDGFVNEFHPQIPSPKSCAECPIPRRKTS